MAKCDLDDCSLKEDIGEIKANQKEITKAHAEMVTTQKLFVQKVDTYMDRGKEEHDILFARTRGIVKWAHLALAIVTVGGFMGIIYGAIRMSGHG